MTDLMEATSCYVLTQTKTISLSNGNGTSVICDQNVVIQCMIIMQYKLSN